MEDKEDKKQNNRKLDEKRDPDSKNESNSQEKEWDPEKNGKETRKKNKF